jgi:hypothetical protein
MTTAKTKKTTARDKDKGKNALHLVKQVFIFLHELRIVMGVLIRLQTSLFGWDIHIYFSPV